MNQPTAKLIVSLAGNRVAVLVEKPENRRYLSSFTGSAGTLLVGQSGAFLITDGRYAEQARDQASGWTVVVERNAVQAVATLVREHQIQEILFDAKSVTYDLHAALQAAVGTDVALTPTYDLIENLRQRKTADELKNIDKAFAITNAAFEYIFGEL